MPKHGFLTPKAIANRIKAKGLTKLRWYCQMCEKPCRDANGFKCHVDSEGHRRQMQIFGSRPGNFLDQFSKEFERGFMDILSRRFRSKRVYANKVYAEYIAERHHTHMNATTWVTLTSFCKYLGKTGKATVENTPKGWYLTYIDRDPLVLAQQEQKKKKQKHDLDHEEGIRKIIQKRIDHDSEQNKTDKSIVLEDKDEIHVELGAQHGEVKFNIASENKKAEKQKEKRISNPLDSQVVAENTQAVEDSVGKGKRKLSAMEEIRFQEESRKKRKQHLMEQNVQKEEPKSEVNERKEYWLHENLIVKNLNKKLANGRYYKKKGIVMKVHDYYVGEIKMLDDDAVIKLDQQDLETVIPMIGGKVFVVNGRYRGELAVLKELDTGNFRANVELVKSLKNISLEYEDLCKYKGE